MHRLIRSLFGFALPLASSTLALPSVAATSGANGTHDPSRMVESNGKFWVFSTGGGSKSSPDGLVWTSGPRIFPDGTPAWVKTAVPNDQGIWAPDVIFYNGQYYLFYSVANKACAVGVLTSPTLDNTQPSFKWTDHGMVVSNNNTSTYCTIDPAPVVDADNNLWVVWGSGYSHGINDDTIFVTRLDNTTGLASATDKKPGYPLQKGHIEAGYIHFHAGNYYLWWNNGGCCSGADSTYTLHVARSTSITGPYSGTRTFYSSKGSIHGPGHIGVYAACGVERFTYHYYPNTGGSVLGENELTWAADGWPQVGPESTTPLKPCGVMGAGGTSAGGTGSGGGSNAAGGAGGVQAGGVNNGGSSAGGSTGVGGSNAGSAAVDRAGSNAGPATSGGAISNAGAPAGTSAGPTPNGTTQTGDASSCSISQAPSPGGAFASWLLAAAGVIIARARRRG